ncbi:MAG: M15 family metallopeptidase [Endomicrobia bacterium]|nr:M15 family metallopeptidase [Endomicrobiia bacterium]MCX7716578.1 M15 family metallopeptidase [Endomicrobiia bacterium]
MYNFVRFYSLYFWQKCKIKTIYFCCIILIFLSTLLFSQTAKIEEEFIRSGLVNVKEICPEIKVHLVYSTTNNFLNKDIYGELENAYLHKEVAFMLKKAQKYLNNLRAGYCLLVLDAARPRRIQQLMWDTLPGSDKEKSVFVANPKTGSIHNYGCAVDVTIVDQKGNWLDMGSNFDDFTDLAKPKLEKILFKQGKLTKQQLQNRKLLRKVMKKAGFIPLEDEWWHFDAFPKKEVRKKYKIIE